MTQRFGNPTAAALLLGSEHPLTTALREIATTTRQLVAVAAVGVAGLLASTAAGGAFGVAVALAAGGMAVILGVRLSMARERARKRARDAIIAGDQNVPIPVLRRQRDRLLKREVRELLAGTYDDLARRAEPPANGLPPPAIAERVALAHDLRGVARLLRDPGLDAPGVARAERLLENRRSPLYGADIDTLRGALRRIGPAGGDRRTAARRP
jgi:hypothetical protein